MGLNGNRPWGTPVVDVVSWGLLATSTLLTVLPDGYPVVALRAWLCALAGFSLLLTAWLLGTKRVRQAVVAWVATLMALGAPLHAGWNHRPVSSGMHHNGRGITVAQLNVHQDNGQFAAVVHAVRQADADLVILQEVDARWYGELESALADQYPWHVHRVGEKNYGMALFSRLPVAGAEAIDLEGLPAIRADIGVGHERVRLVAVHLRAPESAAKLQQRNRQWRKLEALLSDRTIEQCLIGDLNTVPWDRAFGHFCQATGLKGAGGVLAPTWPAWGDFALLPLDHVLVSPGMLVTDQHTFPIPGSDHLGKWAGLCPASMPSATGMGSGGR